LFIIIQFYYLFGINNTEKQTFFISPIYKPVRASPGHIYNLQKEGGFWWWALAENDVYYDDYPHDILVGSSKSNADAGAYTPISWGVKRKWTRLDIDKAEAFIRAWFYNNVLLTYWEAECYAWVDPPYKGGYHRTI